MGDEDKEVETRELQAEVAGGLTISVSTLARCLAKTRSIDKRSLDTPLRRRRTIQEEGSEG